MKTTTCLFLLILLAGPAAADSSIFEFTTLEAYGKGGIDNASVSDTQEAVNALTDAGVDASGSVKVDPAFGIRAGVMLFSKDRMDLGLGIDLGLSVGFVLAPRVVTTLNNGPFSLNGVDYLTNGHLEIDTRPYFYRVLLETGRTFDLRGVSLRLGAGAGAAFGNVQQYDRASGSAAALFDNANHKETWTGFTWELSPSLLFPIGSTELEAGVRYSHFPKKKATDDIAKLEWDPWSVFLGLRY